MSPLIVIPAAGASSRMRGRDKLLEEPFGLPLLRRQAMAALETDHDVLVLIRPGDTARRKALDGLPVEIADVPDAAEGIAGSLRLGAQRAGETRAMAVLLPDVPGIAAGDIRAVLDAFDGKHVTRASDPDGRPGTPVVIPPRLVAGFADLRGDDGGKSILVGEDIHLVPFPDDRATRDLDTPEDWAKWLAAQNPAS